MTMYPTIPTVLKDGAEMPQYAHDGDAGLDLFSTEDVTLLPQEWCMVGSGAFMAIPKGFVGLVVPRSGMGCKGLVLKNTIGIIDAPYRGEVKVPLLNNNPIAHTYRDEDNTIHVHKGDRVAQLLIVPVAQASLVQVDTLDETERGEGSFGSTDHGISGGERL